MKNKELKALDPDSEYFRTCPHCSNEYMADDLRQKYCCQACHDAHHNRIKRFKRASEPVISPLVVPAPNMTDKIMIDLKLNVSILNAFRIGREGIIVNIDDLEGKGFNFEAYTSRFSAAKKENSFFAEYGPFIINLESNQTVLIRTKNF